MLLHSVFIKNISIINVPTLYKELWTVYEEAIWFAYEFDKEGRRKMVDIFPSSLAYHWEPMTSYPICRSQGKWKCGTQNKHVGPLVQEIWGISRQKEQRWPFEQQRSQASGANSGFSESTPWELLGFDFPEKMTSWTRGKPKHFSTLSSECVWALRSQEVGHLQKL